MKDEKEKEKEPDFERNCIVGEEYPIWYKDQKFIFVVGVTDLIHDVIIRPGRTDPEFICYYKPKTKLVTEEKYTGWFGRQKTRMVDVGAGWRYHKATKEVEPDTKVISFKDVWMPLKAQLEYALKEYALKTHVVDNRAFIIDCSPELEKFR